MSSTGAAGDGLLRGGCISGGDMGINRRPYHKNCKCALHGQSRGHCTHSSARAISYPMRRVWSDGCLAALQPPTSPLPAPPPAGRIPRTQTHLVLCNQDEDADGDLDNIMIQDLNHISLFCKV